MSYEKIDRNREIYIKSKNGASRSELAKEYGLTVERIRQIITDILRHNLTHSPDVIEIGIACKELGASEWMNGRIQAVFRRRHLNVKNRWRRLSREDILDLRNLGPKSADIIEYAQKL